MPRSPSPIIIRSIRSSASPGSSPSASAAAPPAAPGPGRGTIRGRFIALAAALHAEFASRYEFLCNFKILRLANTEPHPGHATRVFTGTAIRPLRGTAAGGARTIRCCPASESDAELDSAGESDWPVPALRPDECGMVSARSLHAVRCPLNLFLAISSARPVCNGKSTDVPFCTTMPPKAKGKQNKVVKVTFPAQAEIDYPQRLFQAQGSKMFASLQDRKKANKKLDKFEEYLVLKHFPKQQQTFNKEQKTAKENDAQQKSAEAAKKARKEHRSEEQAQIYQRKVRKFLESMLMFEFQIESQIHKGSILINLWFAGCSGRSCKRRRRR